MALANAERQARYRSGGRLASPGSGTRPADRRSRGHRTTPPRRAARRYAPTGVGSAAPTTKSVSSPRTAARGTPRRVDDRALLEQVCNLDRCTLRTHGCHGGGTGRISGTEWEGPTAQRRCAPTSVPLRRNPCSTSPECVFHFTEIRTWHGVHEVHEPDEPRIVPLNPVPEDAYPVALPTRRLRPSPVEHVRQSIPHCTGVEAAHQLAYALPHASHGLMRTNLHPVGRFPPALEIEGDRWKRVEPERFAQQRRVVVQRRSRQCHSSGMLVRRHALRCRVPANGWGCLGRPERIAYGTSNDRPKLLITRQLRYFASGCGRNWNFTRMGFDTDPYSPFSTASPSSACHTVSEPVDE